MAYWFRPRRYGYGATPTSWQGVVALIAFPVVVVVVALLLFLFDVGPEGPSAWRFVVFVAAFLIGLAAFLAFVRARTDGEWRWRWGRDGNT
jgi:uncharacterized membrane protein YbhN (UPF0104 family)